MSNIVRQQTLEGSIASAPNFGIKTRPQRRELRSVTIRFRAQLED